MPSAVMTSGRISVSATSSNYYVSIGGSALGITTNEQRMYTKIYDDLVWNKAWVRITANTRDGTCTFVSRKNGATANQSIAIGAGLTGAFEDAINQDNLVNGDLINYSMIIGGTTGSIGHTATRSILTHGGSEVSYVCCPGSTNNLAAGVHHLSIIGRHFGSGVVTEASANIKARGSATLSKLRIFISTNTTTSPSTLIVLKNSIAGNQSITIGAGLTGFFEDATNQDSIVDGDLICHRLTNGGGGNIIFQNAQMRNVAATSGRIAGAYFSAGTSAWTFGLTNYSTLEGELGTYVTELESQIDIEQAARIYGVRMYINTNTVDGASTLTLRKDNASTNIAVIIGAGLTGAFEDASNTTDLISTSLVNWLWVTAGTTGSIAVKGFSTWLAVVSVATSTALSPQYPNLASQYLVRLYNTSGILVAVFDNWISLNVEKRLNTFHTHQFSIDGLDSRVSLFEKDSFVEVLRRVQGLGLNWYQEYIGFHRTPQRQITSNGRRIFTSYGRGLQDLLQRRDIAHYAGSTGAAKSGAAETVVKDYVDENAGPSATAPPRFFSGVTTGLTIEADAALGATWTGSRPSNKLSEVVKEIAEFAGLVIDVVSTGPATFEFRVKEPDDRTNTGLDPTTGRNSSGNVPVTFAPELANMTSPSFTVSATEEITAAIVLGQGQEADRAVRQRTSSALSDSPWNRVEDTRDARQESTNAGLDALGDEVLEEGQERENFDFTVLQTISCAYGLHYFLSDLINARFEEIERQKQITEVRITVAEGKEQITISLGDLA